MTDVKERESYLMRAEERRYLLYLFEVDSAERVTRVELIPTIGTEHPVYEKADNGRHLRTWNRIHVMEPLPEFQGATEEEKNKKRMEYLGSKEDKNRDRWEKSEPTLVDRLGVSDPIVRDAFNEGTTAGQLFMHYKLVSDSGMR